MRAVSETLEAFFDFRRYERLPYAGGLRDQPYEWKQQMDAATFAWQKVERERHAQQKRESAGT